METPHDLPRDVRISHIQVGEPFPLDALDRLRAAASRVDEVVYDEGPVNDIEDTTRRQLFEFALDTIADDPDHALLNPGLLDLVIASSFVSAAFDLDDLRTVRDALARLDADEVSGRVTDVRLYLLTRDEMLDFVVGDEIGST